MKAPLVSGITQRTAIKRQEEEGEATMAKQIYTARIEVELMIIAESADGARMIAARSLKEEASNFSWVDFDTVLSNGKLAKGWVVNALPYGKNENKTVGGWIGGGE